MGVRGVHFAIDDAALAALKAQKPEARLDYVAEVIEAPWDEANLCETDSAWAYIHAALTDTDPDGDFVRVPVTRPAQLAIQGSVALVESDEGLINLIASSEVPAVAADLASIDGKTIGEKAHDVVVRFEPSGDPADAADYVLGWYPGLVEFFERAAAAGKNIIFTVNY